MRHVGKSYSQIYECLEDVRQEAGACPEQLVELKYIRNLTVVIEQEPVESPISVRGNNTVAVGARRQRSAIDFGAVQRRWLVGLELTNLDLSLRQSENQLVRPSLRPRHAGDRRRLRELVADALALHDG